MLELKVPRKIDLTGIKRFAIKELPLNSTLREMILAEKDQIQAEEFLVKMEIWMRLFDREMKLKELSFSFNSIVKFGNKNKRVENLGVL